MLSLERMSLNNFKESSASKFLLSRPRIERFRKAVFQSIGSTCHVVGTQRLTCPWQPELHLSIVEFLFIPYIVECKLNFRSAVEHLHFSINFMVSKPKRQNRFTQCFIAFTYIYAVQVMRYIFPD